MKRVIQSLIFAFLCPLCAMAQWPSNVELVTSKENDSVFAKGDLSKGKIIEDLAWASSSSNACFVATQNTKYRSNHVFYATTIPPHSVMTISVIPDDNTANMSMYAYMMGTGDYYIVPDLPQCITCEADFKWDGNWRNRVQTQERKVEFNNPTNNTYNIVIGVSAPKGTTTGTFQVKIITKS
jgi:hypothetical protein